MMSDEKQKKLTVPDFIERMKLSVQLGLDGNGQCWACITQGGHADVVPLLSPNAINWITDEWYGVTGAILPKASAEIILTLMQNQAIRDESMQAFKVCVRSAPVNAERIEYALHDRDKRIVVVTPEAVSLAPIADAHLHFAVQKGMQPQVAPDIESEGDLSLLHRFVRTDNERMHVLVLAWIAYAIAGTGPYPLLTLEGQAGAGKSMLARFIRRTIDPHVAPFEGRPGSERDLAIQCSNSKIVVLDNMRKIRDPFWSDRYAGIATGSAMRLRSLYTNNSEEIFHLSVPLMMTSIEPLAVYSDLANRMLTIQLEGHEPGARETEGQLNARIDEAFGDWITGIFQLIRKVLAVRPTIDASEYQLPRMADFALFAIAVGQVLEISSDDILKLYAEAERASSSGISESDGLVDVIVKHVKRHGGQWSGTAQALYGAVEGNLMLAGGKMPKSPSALGRQLTNIIPTLATLGVQVMRRKTGGVRNIELSIPTQAEAEDVEPGTDT